MTIALPLRLPDEHPGPVNPRTEKGAAVPDEDTTKAPKGASQARRQWTLDELAVSHPLPGDWEWMPDGRKDGIQLFTAVILDYDYGEPEVSAMVSIDGDGQLHAEPDPAPVAVALAVILVALGLEALGEAQP